MNEHRPADEDEFAERLKHVEQAARTNDSTESDDLDIEDPHQQEQLKAAARVIGMIHRVRKSKNRSAGEPDIRETVTDKLDTRRSDQAKDAMPENAAVDSISAPVDGTIPQRLGRFQIKRKLGQGGYGLVFLALDPQLDREVALKVPRAEALVDASVRARFLREAKAAGGLNHANIVPVFEAGHVGPVCYIASAFCQGPSLGQWVRDHDQPVSPNVAAEWLMTLADAVQHAHSRGIIHRDLKPDNVLVEFASESNGGDHASTSAATPLLRITDFGLAKDLDDPSELTQSGSVLGTPSFMAPEQTDSRSGESGLGVDIYGLGAILYFLLCRVPPISGNSLLDTIDKVRGQPPVPPGKLRPEIPRDLEAICLKCLEKQPRHRYQTASELQSDLLRFRDGLPVLARRPSTLDRALMWCRRRPAVSALAASLLIVLAISSVALGVLLARSNSLKIISDANASLAAESASLAIVERNRSREALQAMTSGVASNWLGAQRVLTAEQKTFLENTVAYYQNFASGSTDKPEDQFWVAQSEHRLAQLFSRLGEFDNSLSSSDRAISLLEHIPADWEPFMVAQELADTLHGKDGSLTRLGKAEDAFPVAQRAAEIARELVAIDPDDVQARELLSKTTGNLGSRFEQTGRLDEALVAKMESVMVLEQLMLDQPDNRAIQRSLGINSMNLGNFFARMNQLDDSRLWLERSMELRSELVDQEPDSAIFQFDLSYLLANIAVLTYRMEDGGQAELLSERATDIARRLVEQYPIEERYRRHLNASLNNLSAIYNGNRKFEKSKSALTEANLAAERCIRDFPNVPIYRLQLANGKSKLATALAEQGDYQEAIEYHDEAVSHLREMIEQSIEGSRATQSLESALTNRATALGYLERHNDAIADWDAVIAITHPDEVNTVWLCRATSLVKLGDFETALAEVERVLDEAKTIADDKRDFNWYYNSACVHSLVSARVEDESESREHAYRAIDLLQQAIDAGLSPIAMVRADPELEPLHSYPEYQAIVQE